MGRGVTRNGIKTKDEEGLEGTRTTEEGEGDHELNNNEKKGKKEDKE